MNHMTNYLKSKIIDENLRTEDVHVGLFTVDGEVDQPSYKRQRIVFGEAVDGQTSNTEDVLFPIAQEDWGDITHIGLFDAVTDGELLFKSPAEYVKAIDVSSQYKIPRTYHIVRLR